MISYNYPPIGSYGSVRSTMLAKYLPATGWLPTVLTVKTDKTRWGSSPEAEGMFPCVKIVRATFPDLLTFVKDSLDRAGLLGAQSSSPGAETTLAGVGAGGKRLVDRVFRTAKKWLTFPDRFNLWFPFAFAAGLRELRSGEYDAIYSTMPPIMDHVVASALHRVTGIPWLADYRDPWTDRGVQDYTPLQQYLMPKIEKRVMAGAAAMVIVSEPLAKRLLEIHGPLPAGVWYITNGFDPDDYSDRVKESGDGRLSLIYAGMLYGTKRDPAGLIQAAEALIEEGHISPREIVFRFFGPTDPSLFKLKGSLRHPGIMEICGVVQRKEAIAEEMRSNVLLIINWDDPYSALLHGGKVFEYLGARRPVLAWNPAGGVLDRLLEETGAGLAVADVSGAKVAILSWLRELRSTGTVAYRGKEAEVSRYGWDRLSVRMAEVLDRVAATRRG